MPKESDMRNGEVKADFIGRQNLALLLNQKGLTGKAVEIGTHKGLFAESFLKTWKGGQFYCVDPYLSGYDKRDPASQGDRAKDFQEASNRLKRFGAVVQFIRKTSVMASLEFEDESLDFAYVDGNHQPEFVRQDVHTWWPKVKPGGIMGGHDVYACGRPGKGWDKFIRPFIQEFARSQGIHPFIITEHCLTNWSFYLEKPHA